MNTERKNPIAEKSKKWLIDALLQLMEDKPYQDISINDIAEKALLSRRTFYRNFSAKEELLSSHFRTICKEYVAYLHEETNLSLPNITQVFFTFWHKHLDFLQKLKNNNMLAFLLVNMNEFLPDIYSLFKGNLNEYASEDDLRYALAFSSGGYWNMLTLWLQNGADKSPQDLAKVIQDAIKAASGK